MFVIDVDECTDSPCHLNANCANTFGSFKCTCDGGYEGDGMSCASNFNKYYHKNYRTHFGVYTLGEGNSCTVLQNRKKRLLISVCFCFFSCQILMNVRTVLCITATLTLLALILWVVLTANVIKDFQEMESNAKVKSFSVNMQQLLMKMAYSRYQRVWK